MDGKRKKVRLSDYPLLQHYGKLGKRLTREEAAVADFDARFNSIGPYVVGASIDFFERRLSREGRVAFDPEDLLLEVRMDLQVRNDRYDKSKGTYLTFARRIISNRLSEILEHTHCVRLPANASEKFKELSEAAELTESQRSRLNDLVSANADHAALAWHEAVPKSDESPDEVAMTKERCNILRTTISDFIVQHLNIKECLAIGYSYGLWDRNRLGLGDAEKKHGMSPGTLRRALASAKRKMRCLCCTPQL